MDRMISYFIALMLAAGLAFGWDRHPPFAWHTKVIFWNVGFSIPQSLASQRDTAVPPISVRPWLLRKPPYWPCALNRLHG
jgi:hypothetical protein